MNAIWLKVTFLSGLIAVAIGGAAARPLYAGVMMGAGPYWQSYTFKPLEREATPNYRGYGFGGNFGYSIDQVVDCDFFAGYTPSRPGAASLAKETARLYQYGAGFALRLDEAVYIGVHGGRYNYRLIHASPGVTGEIAGEWQGVGGMISLGAFMLRRKEQMSQVTFDLGSAALKPLHPLADGTKPARHIDTFSISIKIIFNRFENHSFSSLFSSGFLSAI